MLKTDVVIAVQSGAVDKFGDLLMVADAVAGVEGKDLYKHAAKMGVAAGDLAACLTEDEGGEMNREGVFDEVAALIIRASIFGSAYGMTARDLKSAIERESSRMVCQGIEKRVHAQIKQSGLAVSGSRSFQM